MRKMPALAMLIMTVTVTFVFIPPANTKSLLRESEIVYGLINPSAGQYADGVSQQLNATDMSILEEGWLNFTYIGYVDEQLFNITQSVQTGARTYEYWLTINVTDRSVIDGTSWWVATYYFGWIPIDIEVGATVALGLSNSSVQSKEVITVEDTEYETWRLYGEFSGVNTTSWYDVHSGHWVKAIYRGPNFMSQWLLVSSNIVTPHEVKETPTASEHGEAILAMAIILLFVLIKKKR
ncbi:MAG: hypothetical protein HWN71_11325 [Desulfobacterales bacterium]|nr:hypothetical protein [Desulfobacterales bacterium]